MGADKHMTTRPETDDESIMYNRLVSDLEGCECVTNVRESTLAGLVVETAGRGWEPDALGVLANHGARIGENKAQNDPWEVFLE